ncbi:hypothetical protein AB205_0050340, partial [Aquarana catesbeiana]
IGEGLVDQILLDELGHSLTLELRGPPQFYSDCTAKCTL